MDSPRKLIVGYDLCEDYSQISCYSYKTFEPIPICSGNNEEFCMIPTLLCFKNETRQWLCGEEAVAYADLEDSVKVDHILTKIRTGEETEILQQKYTGITLLEKYLRKTLSLIKNYFPTEPITKLVVTIRDTEPNIVDGIYEALSYLGIDRDRAVVMNHAGAYLYYALSQDSSLWRNDVGLFDFNSEGLRYYQVNINRRMKPVIAGITRSEYNEILNFSMLEDKKINLSYTFENIVNTALLNQIVSTLYFTGSGFEGEWIKDVLKKLCTGRRVFLGQNLYTKGACYAAKEFSGDQKLKDYILLNDEMVLSSVYLKVYRDTRMKEIPLVEAGTPWYEVNSSIELIPENETELEILVKNIMTRETTREKVILEEIPARPDRMTRLEVNLTCTSKTLAVITVNDLGFGEFYAGIGKIMEFTLRIG